MRVEDVRDALEKAGVSVSTQTLYGWENGYRQPDADTFLILSEIYGIKSIAEITGSDSKAEPPRLSAEAMRIANAFDAADEKSRRMARLALEDFMEAEPRNVHDWTREEMHEEVDRQFDAEEKGTDEPSTGSPPESGSGCA